VSGVTTDNQEQYVVWKIQDLPEATLPLDGTELVALEKGGDGRRISVADLIPDSTLEARLADPVTGVTHVSGGDFSLARARPAGFASAEARSLESLFADCVRIDVKMGLVPDSIAAADSNVTLLNQILASAAAKGVPVDGFDALFYVSAPVEIPSGLRLRRVTFKSAGAPAGDMSAKSFIPVIQFSDVTDGITDVVMDEVWADGSRSLWPRLNTTLGEDGGMHAWRMAGAVRDCYFRNCGGINAATAGLAITNPLPSKTTADFIKRNLEFENFTATGNAQHGWFVDGAKNIRFIGGTFTGNGLDLSGADPDHEGSHGRRYPKIDEEVPPLFGAPFDIESYGIDSESGFLGSLVSDILVTNADCRGNAIMPVFYNPIPSNLPGFVIAENMRFTGCLFDSGLATGADRPAGLEGVAFNISGNPVGTTWPIGTLVIDGIMNGRPQVIGVRRFVQSSGFIESTVNKAILHNCGIFDVSAPSNAVGIIVTPQPDVSLVKTAGSPASTISKTLQATRASAQCGIELVYDVAINDALAADGAFAANVVPPSGYIVGSVVFEIVTVHAVPVAKSASLNVTAGTATLFVDTVTGQNLLGSLRVILLPSE